MEKVLIIHTAFIGDIVLSTPIIEKIKKTNNNIEVYYLTTPAGKAVLQNNPNKGLDKQYNMEGQRG